MLAEGLQALTNLAVLAAKPQPIESGNPSERAYVINGGVVTAAIKPSPRDHKAHSLDDLISLANRFSSDDREDGPVTVWYSESAVVAVIDDGHLRHDRVTFTLTHSDVFAKLLDLAKSKAKHDQKAFVRLLRIDLAGTLDPVVLLNAVRAVRWSSTTDVNVGKQRESLGRDIEARCTDGKDLPEEVVLQVPIYRQRGERDRVPIRCSVEVDAGEGTFRLLPLPDELDRAQQMAMVSINERLAAALNDVESYYGEP